MTNTAAKGENVMTDFQFKALMAMVTDILERSESLEEAKKTIAKYAGEFKEFKEPEKEEKEQ